MSENKPTYFSRPAGGRPAFVQKAVGLLGFRGAGLASWIVACGAAYYIWVKPEQEARDFELAKRTAYIEDLKAKGQWSHEVAQPIAVSHKR